MEALESKDWKERKEFYTNIKWTFEDNPLVLQKISRESTVPALESALKAILSCPQLTYKDSKQILSNINNIKLKDLFRNYIFALVKSESKEEVIEDILNCIKTIKLGKTVQIYCELLSSIVVEFRDVPFEVSFLGCPLNHSDPVVRKEGIKLCVAVHSLKGEDIFNHLGNVKDILIKDIREAIGNNITNNIGNNVENNVGNNIDKVSGSRSEEQRLDSKTNTGFMSHYKGINRITFPTSKIFSGLKSSNYKEKIEVLREIQTCDFIINQELQNLIVLKIDDANLQVCVLAIECCVLIKLGKDIIRTLCEKLKDKRLKSIILAVLHEKAIKSEEIFNSVEFGLIKNPAMKCGILEYVLNNEITEGIIPEIALSIEDGNKDVREFAMKCCKKVASSNLSALLPSKVIDKLEKDLSINKEHTNINIKREKNNFVKENREPSLMTEENNQQILEYFSSKYPFLAEKNPMKRYEELVNSEIFLEPQFVIFACTYKDSFFKNNIIFIEKLVQREIKLNLINYVFRFWIEKIGELKLKNAVYDLIIYLSKLDKVSVVESLYSFINEKRVGKLFCEGVLLLGFVGDETSLEFIESIEKRGKLEKDAAIETIERIKNGSNNYLSNSAKISQSKIIGSEATAGINNEFQGKRKHSPPVSAIIKQMIKTRVKDCKNKEIIFTDHFLNLLQDSNSYLNVLDLFDGEDKIYLSDFIIEYIYKHELVTVDADFIFAFIDRLMDLFIEKEYVLREYECIMLYEIVHTNKRFIKKLEYVYPQSKLERLISNRNDIAEINTSLLSFNIHTSNLSSPASKIRKKVSETKTKILYDVCKTNTKIDSSMEIIDSVPFKSNNEIVEKNDIINNSTNFTLKVPEYNKETIRYDVPINKADIYNLPMSNEGIKSNLSMNAFISSDNESSSLVNPDKIEKYRTEFFKKNNEGLHFDRIKLERIFLNLIHSDTKICKSAFLDLRNVVTQSINSVLFSCNSIVSSILIQLNDSLITNNEMSGIIIDTLHKLCISDLFVKELSFSSLRAINIEMMNNLKLANDLNVPLETKNSIITASADILTNINLNSNQPLIFKVYLSLIEFIKDEHKQILYNLIWNHAKNMNILFNNDNRIIVQEIIDTLSEFLEKNCLKLIRNNTVAMKVIQFHLNEICGFYKNNVYEYRTEGLVRKIIDKIMGKAVVSINEIKDNLENIKRDFQNK